MNEFLDFISISLPTMLISVANIFILYLILKRFLFSPINKIIGQRETEISSIYTKAEYKLDESSKLKQTYDEKMSLIQVEKENIIKEAQEEAKVKGAYIIKESRDNAEQIKKETIKDLEIKRKKMYKEIRTNVADLAVSIAEKVIEREVNADLHKDIVSNFVNELELNHE